MRTFLKKPMHLMNLRFLKMRTFLKKLNFQKMRLNQNFQLFLK
jgi:hypothetical protein